MCCLAEGISGSEEEFVVLMNEKAEEIGMNNTNFSNSQELEIAIIIQLLEIY